MIEDPRVSTFDRGLVTCHRTPLRDPVYPTCLTQGEVERETGFEPASSSLESSRSTVELLPLGGALASKVGSHAVTVGANHIALGSLNKDPAGADPSDHARDGLGLGPGFAVVELHRVRWEHAFAIAARHCTQLLQELDMAAPIAPLTFEIPRAPKRPLLFPIPLCSNGVAVGANHVALCRLCGEHGPGLKRSPTAHKGE